MILPPPSAARIADACASIDPVFTGMPIVRQEAADALLGCRLIAKVETLNPIRSFKGRGTSWFVHGVATHERLVTASAGNFGQGLAYAARARGMKVVVFAATTANPLKIEAMRRLGADVRLEGLDFDAAKAAARRYADKEGARLVVDGDDPAIAEGAGTIAAELTRAGATPDAILVPLGNGALATGVGAWMRAESPRTKVIAVVAENAAAMKLSFEAGRPIETETAATIADGIAVRVPIDYALDTMKATVDEVIAVPDDAILSAMRMAHEIFGLVVEPAGAAGLAAVLHHPARFAGLDVATIFCGGNLTPGQIRDRLQPA